MQCPRCNSELAEGTYASHQAFYCHACSGALFQLPALGQALERLSADLFSSVDPASPIEPIADHLGDVNCPQCAQQMENYGYMGTRSVMLDACNRCEFVWVDPMELATMAQMRVRLDKNMQRFNDAHRPTDIVSAHINADIVGKSLLAAFAFG